MDFLYDKPLNYLGRTLLSPICRGLFFLAFKWIRVILFPLFLLLLIRKIRHKINYLYGSPGTPSKLSTISIISLCGSRICHRLDLRYLHSTDVFKKYTGRARLFFICPLDEHGNRIKMLSIAFELDITKGYYKKSKEI